MRLLPVFCLLRVPAVQRSRWHWVGLLAWATVVGVNAQPHGERLEPAERARLRHELREQAWGHRPAERAARHAARHANWQDAAGAPVRPMAPPPPVGAGAELPTRLAPVGDAATQAPGVWTDPAGERSFHRLSPDERRHLRWQLHEERLRRREQGELPQR